MQLVYRPVCLEKIAIIKVRLVLGAADDTALLCISSGEKGLLNRFLCNGADNNLAKFGDAFEGIE